MNEAGLAGCGVLITRPEHQSRELVSAVEAAGGDAIRFPAIDIVGRNIEAVTRELSAYPDPDIIVFVSINAVAHGLSAVRDSGAKIAAVGPSTRDAIEAKGMTVDICPDDGFDSEHLLDHAALGNVSGRNVLIMRGQSGRNLLADVLRERGADVNYLRVYDRLPHTPSASELKALQAALDAGRIRYVTVMSVKTLDCLVRILPGETLRSLQGAVLVAPSTRVLQKASELIPGIATELAPGPQARSMINALIRLARSGRTS